MKAAVFDEGQPVAGSAVGPEAAQSQTAKSFLWKVHSGPRVMYLAVGSEASKRQYERIDLKEYFRK